MNWSLIFIGKIYSSVSLQIKVWMELYRFNYYFTPSLLHKHSHIAVLHHQCHMSGAPDSNVSGVLCKHTWAEEDLLDPE